MNPVYIIFLIVLPLVAIFLKEPLGTLIEKKKHDEPFKWGAYCTQSFFEVFEATSVSISDDLKDIQCIKSTIHSYVI